MSCTIVGKERNGKKEQEYVMNPNIANALSKEEVNKNL